MTTNYERIKQMSVEQMAEFYVNVEAPELLQCKICSYMAKLPDGTLLQCCDEEYHCKEGIKQWLESEAEWKYE